MNTGLVQYLKSWQESVQKEVALFQAEANDCAGVVLGLAYQRRADDAKHTLARLAYIIGQLEEEGQGDLPNLRAAVAAERLHAVHGDPANDQHWEDQ
jgi:hypothetical protein